MLFKRRDKQSVWARLRNIIWPSMGWKRSLIYLKYRVLRIPHSTHDIAMGLAAGCAVSWTPTWGIQILQCYIFCKIVRANFLAALLGTMFGNPWTFPFLIWVSYIVGSVFIDLTGLDYYFAFVGADTMMPDDGGRGLNNFAAMLIGGYILAVVTFPVFYYMFYYMVKAGRAAKVKVKTKVHDIIDHRKENKK